MGPQKWQKEMCGKTGHLQMCKTILSLAISQHRQCCSLPHKGGAFRGTVGPCVLLRTPGALASRASPASALPESLVAFVPVQPGNNDQDGEEELEKTSSRSVHWSWKKVGANGQGGKSTSSRDSDLESKSASKSVRMLVDVLENARRHDSLNSKRAHFDPKEREDRTKIVERAQNFGPPPCRSLFFHVSPSPFPPPSRWVFFSSQLGKCFWR